MSQINIVLFLFFNSITRNHKNHLQGNAFVNRHGNRHSGWLSDIWQCLFIVISVYELNNREIASFAIKMAKICAPKITKLSSKFETKRWPTWVHNLLPSVLTCHVDMASELVTRRDLIATVSDTSSIETCADYHGKRSICPFCFLPNCRSSYWRSRYTTVLCYVVCLFVRLSVTLSICDVCIVAYGVS